MDVVSDAISAVRQGRPSSNRVRAGGSWCVRLDPYEGAGFHVVLAGRCWLLPDGGGPPVALGTGDAVLLPHGTGHVLADSPADAATVARAVPFERWREETGPRTAVPEHERAELLCGKYRLDRSRAHPLMAELPEVVVLAAGGRPDGGGGDGGGGAAGAGESEQHRELRAAIALLGAEQDPRRPGSGIALPNLLDLLLVYMLRSWMAEAATGTWPAALGDPVAATALQAIHADPAAAWTVASLAAEAGVSRPTLVRRFTPLVGRPPMAYVTWWRLTLAATLLRDTSASLTTIARRVGYGSPYAFSHAFAREFGTTPGRFRSRTANARPPAA
ncbi:AraC family transcriptional regulator [Streptomyces sp. NPDC002073]